MVPEPHNHQGGQEVHPGDCVAISYKSAESDSACSLWEQKTKTNVLLIRINRLILVGSTMFNLINNNSH